MGKVINLNRYRKQKAKADRRKQADVNRRLHGRTKAEVAREALQKQRLTHALDGAKLEGDTSAVLDEATSHALDTAHGKNADVNDPPDGGPAPHPPEPEAN